MKVAVKTGSRRYTSRLKPLWRIDQYIALVDLSFLLLFFLLLSSSVVRISGIRVNLPRTDVPQTAGMSGAILTITPPAADGENCRIYFRDRQIDTDQLRRELLSDTRKEKVLVIRADEGVPSGILMKIVSIAESAKMESFFAVQPLANRSETRFVE